MPRGGDVRICPRMPAFAGCDPSARYLRCGMPARERTRRIYIRGHLMKARAAALLVVGAFVATQTVAEPKFSPWGEPVNLAADEAGVLHCGGINTASNDAGPAI